MHTKREALSPSLSSLSLCPPAILPSLLSTLPHRVCTHARVSLGSLRLATMHAAICSPHKNSVMPDRAGSKTSVQKNEEIVRIPRSLVLSRGTLVDMFEEDIPADEMSQGAVDGRANLIWGLERMDKLSNQTNTEAHVLSFFILFNRAVPKLFNFQPWLGEPFSPLVVGATLTISDILPEEFHNPIHFEEDTIELLVGSELYGESSADSRRYAPTDRI